MLSSQTATPKSQINQTTQLDLTQFRIIKEEKKTSAFPVESISSEKPINLVGNWLVTIENEKTSTSQGGVNSRDTVQALNIKTNAKKSLNSVTNLSDKRGYNGAIYSGRIEVFGDWIALNFCNYIDSSPTYALAIINVQTEEKEDLIIITAPEKYTALSLQPLDESWCACIASKADQTHTLMFFNVQTRAIKTLSANNKKCSLLYRDSLHPTIICYQDDKGRYIFDYEQWKELPALPENTEVVRTVTKPKIKDYLTEITNLKNNPAVEDVIATNLELGDILVETLVMNVLPQQKALKHLDLRGNKLTDESARFLYMAILKYPQLLEIQLDNNAISNDWQQAIAERLKRNQSKPTKITPEPVISNIKIPAEYLCPLSMCIMADPVMAPDGETYEREEIETYLKSNTASPITYETFKDKTLTPNNSIKKLIHGFLNKNPDLREGDKFYLSKRLIVQCVEAIKIGDSQALIQALDKDIRLLTVPLENYQTLLLLTCQQDSPVILEVAINQLLQKNCLKQALRLASKSNHTAFSLLKLTAQYTGFEGVKLLTQAFDYTWINLEQQLLRAINALDPLLTCPWLNWVRHYTIGTALVKHLFTVPLSNKTLS